MATSTLNLRFPVGRVVQGDLYTPQTKDNQGNPLTVKTGPNAGQPTQQFFFAVAYAKNGTNHWGQTDWGSQILAKARADWPAGQTEAPTFAWKIEDGDSVIPNKRGRKNADRVGFPGHWVVEFSSTMAPKLFTRDGRTELVEKGIIKRGHYVEVFGSVRGNGNEQNPGIYINHMYVAHSGYGEEISSGPDVGSVGFGAAPLPAAASAIPLASNAPPAGALPMPGAGASAPPPPAPAPQTAVAPAPGFLPLPGAGAAAPPPPPPPVIVGPVMTAKAAGNTYAAMIAAGWTDDSLRAHGYMA